MRSTKDLKEIVSSVRTKSNLNGIAGQPVDVLAATADTEAGTDYGAPSKGSSQADSQANAKKEYHKLLKEHDNLKRQYNEMKRNYQSMSNFAHNDKADQFRLSQLKEEYEKAIAELKRDNGQLKVENTEKTEEIKTLRSEARDHANRTEAQQKEIDRLQAELKKKDKQHEDRIKSINSKCIGFRLCCEAS